jgi:hypothetical protein
MFKGTKKLTTGNQPESKSASTDAQERDADDLRRAYQRRLRHRPTNQQRDVFDRAATYTARAKFAAVDPCVTLNQLVRIENLARKARAEAETPYSPPPPGPNGNCRTTN